MSEPSLTESFVEVACCDAATARAYLQRSAGDMTKALAKYFQDQEKQWDAPRCEPGTQPVVAKDAAESNDNNTNNNNNKTHGSDGESTTAAEDGSLKKKECTEQQRQCGQKQKRSIMDDDADEYDHLDPSLPWNKYRFNGGVLGKAAVEGPADKKKDKEEGGLPKAGAGVVAPPQDFVYDAIKSKVQTTNFQGPQDGSTWHWFLVADQRVFPDGPDASGNGSERHVSKATTYINGDKFQAGWARTADEKLSEKTMATRKASMLGSVMDHTLNSYGKTRRGCKPGYSHRWTYADSTWSSPSASGKGKPPTTTECFWDEQKNTDRWLVNVHMKWQAQDDSIETGVYVIVADQMATKLNKNQYQTSMRGRRWRIGGFDASEEELQAAKNSVLAQCVAAIKSSSPIKPAKLSPVKKQKMGTDK